MRRPIISLVAACAGLVLPAATCAAPPPDQILELQVKSAFLYNFAKFVEWPEAGSNTEGSFTFCVMGADPVFPVLAQGLRGKTLNGRTVAARRVDTPSAARQCNVVFFGSAGGKDFGVIAPESGVLTVGDFDRFTQSGGMIQLIKEENRFRFAINLAAVSRAGLRMSSKLLQLAGTTEAGGRSRP